MNQEYQDQPLLIKELETPRILVFSFDEKCENIITNFSISRFISKNKKNTQQEYIDAIINKIKESKSAVVVICTNNSLSSMKSNHYQHIFSISTYFLGHFFAPSPKFLIYKFLQLEDVITPISCDVMYKLQK